MKIIPDYPVPAWLWTLIVLLAGTAMTAPRQSDPNAPMAYTARQRARMSA